MLLNEVRYLGIDYGEKRIGVAISDEGGSLAFPYKTVPNTVKKVEVIEKVCRKENIEHIVIGESLTYKGEPNVIMEEIKKFADIISEKVQVPVSFHPEILTTQEARRYAPSIYTKVDKEAAAIILQSYLDMHKRK
ncbi:MAG TPA: Holliday junction resolvase RuvX [Candidatus Paceibacterota bacterium]